MAEISCEPQDVPTFLQVAQRAQAAAKVLAARQNEATVLTLTPDEVTQLATLLRTASPSNPITLNAREGATLVGLLNLANKSAVYLPAHDPKGLCVIGLVNTLLDAGNLLEVVAKAAQQPESVLCNPTQPT